MTSLKLPNLSPSEVTAEMSDAVKALVSFNTSSSLKVKVKVAVSPDSNWLVLLEMSRVRAMT